MAIYYDKVNNFALYDTPKSGSTTIRAWILEHYGNPQPVYDGYYLIEDEKTSKILEDNCYDLAYFKSLPAKTKIAIKRDPLDRFISCFSDKKAHVRYSLDKFLNNFDEVVATSREKIPNPTYKFLEYHFCPQTSHLGNDLNYYNYVIPVEHLTSVLKPFLEDLWGHNLTNHFARKQSPNNKVTLSDTQIDIVKNIYHEDYENGWF